MNLLGDFTLETIKKMWEWVRSSWDRLLSLQNQQCRSGLDTHNVCNCGGNVTICEAGPMAEKSKKHPI